MKNDTLDMMEECDSVADVQNQLETAQTSGVVDTDHKTLVSTPDSVCGTPVSNPRHVTRTPVTRYPVGR